MLFVLQCVVVLGLVPLTVSSSFATLNPDGTESRSGTKPGFQGKSRASQKQRARKTVPSVVSNQSVNLNNTDLSTSVQTRKREEPISQTTVLPQFSYLDMVKRGSLENTKPDSAIATESTSPKNLPVDLHQQPQQTSFPQMSFLDVAKWGNLGILPASPAERDVKVKVEVGANTNTNTDIETVGETEVVHSSHSSSQAKSYLEMAKAGARCSNSTNSKSNLSTLQNCETKDFNALLVYANDLRHDFTSKEKQREAEKIFKDIVNSNCDPEYVSQAYLGLAKIENRRGDSESSIKYAYASLKVVETDLRTLAWLSLHPFIAIPEKLSYIEKIFQMEKELQRQVEQEGKVLSDREEKVLKLSIGQAHLARARLKINTLQSYKDALEITESLLRDGGNLADVRGVRARAHMGLALLNKDPIAHYTQALSIAQAIGKKTIEAEARIGLANQGIDSLNHLNTALNLAKQSNFIPLQIKALMSLALASGDLSYLEQALEFSDKIDILYIIDLMLRFFRDRNHSEIQYKMLEASIGKQADQYSQFEAYLKLGKHKIHQKENFEKALDLAYILNDPRLKVKVLIENGKANILPERNFQQALYIANTVLDDQDLVRLIENWLSELALY